MEKLTRVQYSTIASYSAPFVLLSALGISLGLARFGISAGVLRLVILSLSFPIGLAMGRVIYLKRSHIEIIYDDLSFRVVKGGRDIIDGRWATFSNVSIALDQYSRPEIKLYRSPEDSLIIPIFGTNADPQEFRDYVLRHLSRRQVSSSLQVVEAA